MSHANSHRQILRSSSIIGGATVINIGIGMLGTKTVAVLLGPSGVGLLGLLQNLVAVVASIAALGLASAGTRQVAMAAAEGDAAALRATRHALGWSAALLGIAGTICFWALRSVFARQVLDRPELEADLAWLSFAVGLSIAAGSQGALLNGLRRVGDMARASMGAGLLATALGIAAVALWKNDGLVFFVLAAPAASFVVGQWFVSRLERGTGPGPRLREIAQQWKGMVRLGMAFMLTGVAALLAQLAVRALVQRELGPGALGLFQAASTLSLAYVGLVLNAMATDYYPRLSGVIRQPAEATRLVNEQTEVVLLLAGPAFLAMIAFAPAIFTLLYSGSFQEAAPVLYWHVVGDVLKVMSWPVGFVFLAAGNGRTFIATDCLGLGVYVLVTWFALPAMGVVATGVGFLAMYAVYLAVIYWLAARAIGFRWHRRNLLLFAAIGLAASCLALLASVSALHAAWVGGLAAFALGIYGARRLTRLTRADGRPAAAVSGSTGMLAKFRGWW